MSKEIYGVCPILATPFDEQGRIDEDSMRSLIEFELRAGAHGLTLFGIAGEGFKLSEAERDRLTQIVVEQVNARVPVIVGSGATGTDTAVMLAQKAEAAGAGALLVLPPYFVKPADDGLVRYYRRISDAVNIPIIVQDEPLNTGVTMSPGLIARLSAEVPWCRYAKIEARPSTTKISALKALAGDQIGVFGGLGGMYCLEELLRGGVGIMTGFAFPEALVQLYQHFAAGDLNKATEVYLRYLPLLVFEGQAGIGLGIRKETLRLRGVISSSYVRHPGPALDETTYRELHRLLDWMGIPN
ncbi:MAG: dihydrodipicolinate synthase family protein [Chloroflexi bacterium]|nr:dihydrodipicolinate synthase family protein [Chloroflexota bacterium]